MFEGESKSFISPRVWNENYHEVTKRQYHNGSGLGGTIILGGDTILHNLHLIKVGLCDSKPLSVDTEEDLINVSKKMN